MSIEASRDLCIFVLQLFPALTFESTFRKLYYFEAIVHGRQ
jgi:hypothetical protein